VVLLAQEVGVVGGMLGGTLEYCSGACGATGLGLTFAPISPVTRARRRLGSCVLPVIRGS
jgi:hypothetical protein